MPVPGRGLENDLALTAMGCVSARLRMWYERGMRFGCMASSSKFCARIAVSLPLEGLAELYKVGRVLIETTRLVLAVVDSLGGAQKVLYMSCDFALPPAAAVDRLSCPVRGRIAVQTSMRGSLREIASRHSFSYAISLRMSRPCLLFCACC